MVKNISLRLMRVMAFGRFLLISIVQNYSRFILLLVVIDLLPFHTVYTVQARNFRLKLVVSLRVLRKPVMFRII